MATWNVAGKSPPSYLNLEDWLHTSPPADIYVLGYQSFSASIVSESILVLRVMFMEASSTFQVSRNCSFECWKYIGDRRYWPC